MWVAGSWQHALPHSICSHIHTQGGEITKDLHYAEILLHMYTCLCLTSNVHFHVDMQARLALASAIPLPFTNVYFAHTRYLKTDELSGSDELPGSVWGCCCFKCKMKTTASLLT